MSDIHIRFRNYACRVVVQRFAGNKRPAITLVDAVDGSPVTRVSVNVPEVELAPDETAVKNHDENEGVMEALIGAGVLAAPAQAVQLQWTELPICKILVEVPE